MAALALRVLPGVLASMLLAGPAFAASAQDSADIATLSHSQEQRRSTGGNRGHKAAQKSQPSKHTQSARRRTPEPSRTTAFVDDSFSYTDAPGQPGWTQTGMASWYGGSQWQGHRTSSGTRYDQDELTAAHASLPLGTRVRVSMPRSGAAVTVLITDRPGTRSRIIDLSRAAARTLGILDEGVAMVTLSPG